jgi:tellurite resistance protein
VSDSEERKGLLDAAFAVAAADGAVGPAELEELRLVSNFLWLDPRDFHAVRARWTRS